jgi:hypothetical protein
LAAGDAYAGACTAKTTIYCANITAGMMLAQFTMRHSSLDLIMSVYVDPVLLDVGAAVDALPAFSDRHVALVNHG